MAELFGFSITRAKKQVDPKQSFTTTQADDGTQTIAAGGYFGRADLGARRHHRRADHRRRREALRGLHRADVRRWHRDLVRLCARAGLPADPAARPVRQARAMIDLLTGNNKLRFIALAALPSRNQAFR